MNKNDGMIRDFFFPPCDWVWVNVWTFLWFKFYSLFALFLLFSTPILLRRLVSDGVFGRIYWHVLYSHTYLSTVRRTGYAFVSRGVFVCVCVCECSAVFQQLKITSRIWSEFLFSATVAAAKLERVWTWTNRFAIGNTMKRRRERNEKMRALTHKSHVRS